MPRSSSPWGRGGLGARPVAELMRSASRDLPGRYFATCCGNLLRADLPSVRRHKVKGVIVPELSLRSLPQLLALCCSRRTCESSNIAANARTTPRGKFPLAKLIAEVMAAPPV
jgi:hypothetical protein